MQTQAIIINRYGSVVEITLNRPRVHNVLNMDMVETLIEVLKQCRDDSTIHCLLIRGKGAKAFCAGGDVRSAYDAWEAQEYAKTLALFEAEYRLNKIIYEYHKLIIVWANGITMGGGLGILQSARIRIITPETLIAMPEIHIGLIPDVGAAQFLNATRKRLGRYLALTGDTISAADAIYLGLANWCVEHNKYAGFRTALSKFDWMAHKRDEALSLDAMLERRMVKLPLSQIEKHSSILVEIMNNTDIAIVIEAFKQAAEASPFLQKGLRKMRYGSPLALSLTWEHLRMKHKHCFNKVAALAADYTVIKSLLECGEFSEGVRALLVDKDRNPQWSMVANELASFSNSRREK